MSVPFLFWGLGSVDLLDPDEGLYAAIAREMLAGGDWIIPHYNGLPYLEKPPLYFWLTAFSLGAFGQKEWVIRLWSALPALGSVLLASELGRLLYGGRAGIMAGLALASSAGYVLYVRKASTDFLLVFSLALAMYGFVRHCTSIVDSQRSTSNVQSPTSNVDSQLPLTNFWAAGMVFWLGMALGVLSKGLIGAIFPLMIVGLFFAVHRLPFTVHRSLFTHPAGWLLFLGLTAPWHILAAWRDPDLFRFYIVDNQILRFLNLRAFVEDDVSVSWPGFLAVTFIWFFPWALFLAARRESHRSQVRLGFVPVAWALAVIGFFTLSGSRLEYYGLPAFPALAVLVGGAWDSGRDIGRWLAIGWAGCTVVGALAVWVASGLTADQVLWGLAELNVYYRILRDQGLSFPFGSLEPFGLALRGLGLALLMGSSIAIVFWFRGWRGAAFIALVGLAGVTASLIAHILRAVEPHHSARPVSAAVAARAGEGDLVLHEGSLEYSAALPFYTGRRIVVVNGERGDLEFASRLPEAKGWFVDEAGLARLWSGPGRVFLVTQKGLDESALSSVGSLTIFEIGRYGSRWLYSNRPDRLQTRP